MSFRMQKLTTIGWILLGCLTLLAVELGCIDQREPGNIWTKQTKEIKQLPALRYKRNAAFAHGGQTHIVLHGIDMKPFPLKRGKKATMILYYQAKRSIGPGWAMFLHLQGGNRSNFRNLDQGIKAALPPLTKWQPGRIYRSTYRFKVPKDMVGRAATFYAGFWHKRKGRMKITAGPNDGSNRLRLAQVPIGGKGPVFRPLPPRPVYVAYKAKKAPVIDGKLDDAIWQKLPSTGPWRYYNNQRQPKHRTEAKITWDDRYLYLAVNVQDFDMWSTFKKRDDPIYNQEVIEFFVDANRDKKDYVEWQVSPAGVIFDTFFTSHRRPRPVGLKKQYDAGALVKIQRQGTVNNYLDRDKGWTFEARFPLKKLAYRQRTVNIPPKDGDEWLVNFFRLELSRPVRRDDHQSWSPPFTQRSGDFHNLYRFGTLRFSTNTPGSVAKRTKAPKAPKRTKAKAPIKGRLVVAPAVRKLLPRFPRPNKKQKMIPFRPTPIPAPKLRLAYPHSNTKTVKTPKKPKAPAKPKAPTKPKAPVKPKAPTKTPTKAKAPAKAPKAPAKAPKAPAKAPASRPSAKAPASRPSK